MLKSIEGVQKEPKSKNTPYQWHLDEEQTNMKNITYVKYLRKGKKTSFLIIKEVITMPDMIHQT